MGEQTQWDSPTSLPGTNASIVLVTTIRIYYTPCSPGACPTQAGTPQLVPWDAPVASEAAPSRTPVFTEQGRACPRHLFLLPPGWEQQVSRVLHSRTAKLC